MQTERQGIVKLFFILTDIPSHVDRKHCMVCMDLSICIFRAQRSNISIFKYIFVPKYCFNLANNADPDGMSHYATFHMGLHCLPKYLLAGISNEELRS